MELPREARGNGIAQFGRLCSPPLLVSLCRCLYRSLPLQLLSQTASPILESCVKVMDLMIIPFSQHRRARRWLSKHHGLLFQTHISWLSKEYLNWRSPSPTSTIFKAFPSFHIALINFFAAILMVFDVRKHIIRLSKNSSSILALFTGLIAMTSSSSVVSFILWISSSTSDSILMFDG